MTSFCPRAYLDEYYSDVGMENRALLAFLVRALADTPPGASLVDIGCGPTPYAAMAAAPRAARVHLADFSEANLAEVRAWIAGGEDAFDWRSFAREVLALEGAEVTDAAVVQRQELTRARITRLMKCDVRAPRPLGEPATYDTVISNFCLEAASRTHAEWRGNLRALGSLVASGGKLMVSTVTGADAYSVGGSTFFALRLEADDLRAGLHGIGFSHVDVHTVDADRSSRQYSGIAFGVAR